MLYPIITESRQLIDLNGIWRFKLDKGNNLTEEWKNHAFKRNNGNGCSSIIQ